MLWQGIGYGGREIGAEGWRQGNKLGKYAKGLITKPEEIQKYSSRDVSGGGFKSKETKRRKLKIRT